LYEANEAAHTLNSEGLKGLVAQVSGTEEQMTKLIAGTFNALVKLADFESQDGDSKAELTGKEDVKAEVPVAVNSPAAVAHAANCRIPFPKAGS
jgi:hypothetical protein